MKSDQRSLRRRSPGHRAREFASVLAFLAVLTAASLVRGPPDFFPTNFRGVLEDGAVRILPDEETASPAIQCFDEANDDDVPTAEAADRQCHWPLPSSLLLGLPVFVNELDAADFESIRGIGPVLAERLHGHRLHKGAVSSLREFAAVRGMGPAKLDLLGEGLGSRVCFAPETEGRTR
jgi:DNA uptake protein and related DNA-binding proteins